MLAYVLNGEGVEGLTKTHQADPPAPGPGEVVVRMRAASLNYRDLLVLSSQYRGRKKDLVPLSDGAGEIVAVGPDVTKQNVGDRVALTFHPGWIAGEFGGDFDPSGRGGGNIDGVLRQYAVVRDFEVVKLPDYLSFAEGATLPCAGVTAWTALTHYAPLLPGEVVVVQGTGGVSLFALQLAKLFRAKIIGLSSNAEKRSLLVRLGADHAIGYESWSEKVLELTDGRGADVVIEVVGGSGFVKSMAATRLGGRISVIGALAGSPEIDMQFFRRMQSIHPIRVGSRAHFLELVRALSGAQLKPAMDQRFAFRDAASAYEYFQSRRHTGKVVIDID
ncbi:NAD(P)-dependent alcohol dehydrogenase [Proteobacteria bacterium 005FR1]|nr:NAD(P)-dependent alcohol dehydrogenase [Proteobacteria bacterium 005FR1]